MYLKHMSCHSRRGIIAQFELCEKCLLALDYRVLGVYGVLNAVCWGFRVPKVVQKDAKVILNDAKLSRF
jgi:hypothetical protein